MAHALEHALVAHYQALIGMTRPLPCLTDSATGEDKGRFQIQVAGATRPITVEGVREIIHSINDIVRGV